MNPLLLSPGVLLGAAGAVMVLTTVAGVGGMWYGEAQGRATVQAKWDSDNGRKITAQTETLQDQRDAAQKLADNLAADLAAARKRHANEARARKASSSLPVVCPASGAVGDVVVPREFIDGMFPSNRPVADPPGSAASGATSPL